jgi:adenylate cyclase
MTTTRRLAAILAADIAGYSRLMAADEVGTLEVLKAARREVVDPSIAEHKGRIVKTTGDGMLVEFASAVDAVTCAMAVQEKMAARGGDIAFRIGINVGDIIIDGDDIFGDGVNVAARVENECQPGGVYLSAQAFDQVRNKTVFAFDDLGERQLKNIDRAVRIYATRPRTSAAMSSATLATGAPLPLPDKPSIAVLPFQNMSGDPEQEYFADGMAEDILTGLSRYRWLFVIARNSSFTYKGKAVDIRQVGRELGVHYALEGSVRRAGGRVRFTAQLIDTSSGNHVWADKYDGPIENLFELQDQITEAVVGILEPAIQQAEVERMRRKRTENLGAYDYYLRSLTLTDVFTRDSVQAMLAGCIRAIALDPSFAPAYALAARVYLQRLSQGWIVDEQNERDEVIDLVERGLRADRLDAMMLGTAGICFAWFGRDLAKGIAYIDEAIAINPNHAHAFVQSGQVRTRAGETRLAIDHLHRAMRLSPRDSRSYAIFQALALAHHVDGELNAAAEWARRAVQHNPNYLPGWYSLASSAASLSKDIEAHTAVEHVLLLDPMFSVARFALRFPISSREKFEPVLEGLRRAGLPE